MSSCLVELSGSTNESFQPSMPALCVFAKWGSKFPLTAWERMMSEQSLSPINEPMKRLFPLSALCYKGITTVWKINKLHQVQHLIEKTGWQAATWETWVSYWTALWCAANHFAYSLLHPIAIRLPVLHRQDWVLLNMYTLLSIVKPLSHLRLLGILVAHIIITLNSSVSYSGKCHQKYSVYIEMLGMKRCHRK